MDGAFLFPFDSIHPLIYYSSNHKMTLATEFTVGTQKKGLYEKRRDDRRIPPFGLWQRE
jgi:hypothetical protein